ncbi:MAG: hypothetical protein LBK27_07110 [Treponema sp.]|jgi:uncharacterized protein YbjQ (UPF0145 family)|nr:hypothetical protein [Treponema sp.]
MKKIRLISGLVMLALLVGCSSTQFSNELAGRTDYVNMAVKDFTGLGIIFVESVEEFTAGPLGFKRTHTGSQITYADLLSKAAELGADDIVNIRIDITTDHEKNNFVDFFRGYKRTYTYRGTALAVKYTAAVNVNPGERNSLGPDDIKQAVVNQLAR